MITQRFALLIMGITTAGIASVIGLVGGLNHFPLTYLVMFVASGVSGSGAGLMVLMKRIGGMSNLSTPKHASKSAAEPKATVKNNVTPAKVVQPKAAQPNDAKPQTKQQPQAETPAMARPVAEPPIASPVLASGGSLVTDIRIMKTQLQRIEWRLDQVSRLIGVDPMEADPPSMELSQLNETRANDQNAKSSQPGQSVAPPAQTVSPTDNPSAEMIHSIAVSKSGSPFVKVPMPDEPKEGKEEVSAKSPQVVSASAAKKTDSNEKNLEAVSVPAKAVEQPSRKVAERDVIDYSDQLRELNQLKQELLRLRSGLLTKTERN